MNRKTAVLRTLTVIALMAGLPLEAGAQGPPADAGSGAEAAASEIRWSLGLGVISSPRPYVGARNSTRVVPLLELYYKRVFVQGIRAGLRITQQGPMTLDAIVGPRFLGYEEDESAFLSGMEERKSSVDVGLSLGWNRPRHGASIWFRHDVAGHSDGAQAGLDLYLRRAYSRGRFRLQPSIGIEWQDRATVDYYYGVLPEEARPDRSAYEPGSEINLSGGVLLVYGLNQRIALTSILRLRVLGDDIADSPIVDREVSYFGLLGLSYRF